MAWIKLAIKTRHPKVLRLSEITGKARQYVYCAVLDWFFWVDEHVEDADTRVGFPGFRDITGWRDDTLAEGMLTPEIDWLTKGADEMLRPTRPESHFNKSAKQRALAAQRMANGRCAASATTPSPRPDQTRPEPELVNPKPRPEGVALEGSVGRSVGQDDETRKMVRALGTNPTVTARLLALPDLTGKEINEVYASVKATPGIDSVTGAVVAELLRRRGQSVRGKRGPMAPVLSGANVGEVAGIAAVRRNRGFA